MIADAIEHTPQSGRPWMALRSCAALRLANSAAATKSPCIVMFVMMLI